MGACQSMYSSTYTEGKLILFFAHVRAILIRVTKILDGGFCCCVHLLPHRNWRPPGSGFSRSHCRLWTARASRLLPGGSFPQARPRARRRVVPRVPGLARPLLLQHQSVQADKRPQGRGALQLLVGSLQ